MPSRKVYRVFGWVPDALPRSPGHASFVPRARQGAGRIDNPDLYGVLYAADSAAGAIAEAFGHLLVWRAATFARSPRGTTPALAGFTIRDDRVLDLDDPRALVRRGMRPSRVVTRSREVTQAWARAMFAERRWSGVTWWSFYDADRASFGLWSLRGLRREGSPQPLSLNHPAVREAAELLTKPIES